MALKKDKLSDGQKSELERLRPFIVRAGLVPQMIGSQWRSAIDAVLDIQGYQSRYRLKAVRDTQDPPAQQWRGPLPDGLPLFNFIEWLELCPVNPGNPQKSYAPALLAALQAKGIPVVETASGIRIIAYRRNQKGDC